VASDINPDNIDGTFPIAGIDNDTQGFRTNFTNTSTNFADAKSEIEDLQSKVILKEPLIGEATTDNTLTTPLIIAVSDTDDAGLNIPEGVAPTAPNDGDVWITAAGEFFARLNGVSINLVLGGGGLPLEVEDESISLSTAVTKINFLGGGVTATEPVAGEIDVTIEGANIVISPLYCPGYLFVFVDTTDFRIDGVDVRGTFKVGAPASFYDTVLQTTVTGRIATSDFDATSAGNTYVTMNMDGGDVLTADILEVCFEQDILTWDPSPNLPFGGDAIIDIAVGDFGGDHYTYCCGGSGNLAYSIDGCVTWTQIVNTRTEGFNQISYSSANQTFMAAGTGGLIARCSDGVTWTYDDTSYLGFISNVNGTDTIHGLVWNSGEDVWQLGFNSYGGGMTQARSINNGVSWIQPSSPYGNTAPPLGNGRLSHIGGTAQTGWGTTGTRTYKYLSPASTSADLWHNLGTANPYCLDTPSLTRWMVGLDDGNVWSLPVDNLYYSYLGNGVGPKVLDVAWSPLDMRWVMACAGGVIQWISGSAASFSLATASNHSFTPGTDINCIVYDESDGVFTAGAASGEIARSSTGT
jgi:hypothetical protein